MSWFGNVIKKIFNNEGLTLSPIKEEIEIPVDLNTMTKLQLEDYGRSLGVELDRRYSKKNLIAQLESL